MDDVCFSVGMLVGRLGEGVLINIFNISSYTAHRSGNPSEISRLRDQEDRRFAEVWGLERRNLDQLDSPLRGQKPFDLVGLESEVSQIRPILRDLLNERPMVSGNPLLFCPAGIGSHRDHLIVRDCVLAERDWLCDAYRVVFYEDLHYASALCTRDRGLHAFLSAAQGLGPLKRYRFPVTGEKLALVRHYRSQFKKLPEDLSDFTPADGSGEPHEATWAVEEIAEFCNLASGKPAVI
jgi:hypothetical protein